MKNATSVIGLRTPDVKATVASWVDVHSLAQADVNDVKIIALNLIKQPFAEEKLSGTFLIQDVLQPLGAIGEKDLVSLAKLFDEGYIADWGSCDSFSSRVLGTFVKQHGSDGVEIIEEWRFADNLWRARASIVALLGNCKSPEGREAVLRCCEVVVKREERFAKTAVGWAMREIAKKDKDIMFSFLNEHASYMSLESVRNAVKHSTEGEKKKYVGLVKERMSAK